MFLEIKKKILLLFISSRYLAKKEIEWDKGITPRKAQHIVILGEQNLLPGMSLLDKISLAGTSLLHKISLAGTSLLHNISLAGTSLPEKFFVAEMSLIEKYYVAGTSLEYNYCLAGTYLVEGFELHGWQTAVPALRFWGLF